MNGDGYADVLIGRYYDGATGQIYVYYGSATGLSSTLGRDTRVADPNPVSGLDQYGSSLTGAGDLNGDGYADVVVGDYYALSFTGNYFSGRAYVYYGSPTGLSPTVGPDWRSGTNPYDWFGYCVAGAGDVNGDGYADLLVGSRASTSYLYYGGGEPGRNATLRLLAADLTSRFTAANAPAGKFGLSLTARPVGGRTRARLVWQTAANGVAFDTPAGAKLANSVAHTGTGAWLDLPAGTTTQLLALVTKVGRTTRVRARLEYATGSPRASAAVPNGTGGVGGQARYGPWQYLPAQQLTYLNASPLPVELAAFTAQASGPATVALAWRTASETNSAAFEVERSADGHRFERIGTVVATGHSAAPRSYQLADAALPAGATLLYYRLRQLDQDGPAAYSPVRPVALAAGRLTLFPNPTRTAATLTGAIPGAAVEVLDVLGRLVATATTDATGTALLALPAGLPSGVYVVRAGSHTTRLSVE